MPIEVNTATFIESPARLRRWRHIRLAAIGLFEERGFADVSIDDIAEMAGVSRRTFFNYFATKGGVMFDPDPEDSGRLAALLDEADPEAGLWDAITQTLLTYLETQTTVITARRTILGVDPSLNTLHMLANSQFEESILTWLTAHDRDNFYARLTSAMALAVVRESFRSWQPETGYSAFMAQLVDGFAIAARGVASGSDASG